MLKKTLVSVLSYSLLFSSFAPVALAQTVDVTGNGAYSTNDVSIESDTETTIVQDNTAEIVNDIHLDLQTGENSASFNTGGDVTVVTGDTNADATILNRANLNQVRLEDVSAPLDISATIDGNGAYSENSIDVSSDQDAQIHQDNWARLDNRVQVEADTGDNDTGFNTDGDVTVVTGHTEATIVVENTANANLAELGEFGQMSGLIDIVVEDNGAFSDNEVEVDHDSSLLVVQDNRARIRNDIDVDLRTGGNSASFNTSGDVVIDTGNAAATIALANLANLNAVAFDTDSSPADLLIRLAGNGAFADSDVTISPDHEFAAFQGCSPESSEASLLSEGTYPCFDLANRVHFSPATGGNDVDHTTGDDADAVILTGHATADLELDNRGNANIIGELGEISLPGGLVLDLDFDLGSIL